jgi:hypothetical protein
MHLPELLAQSCGDNWSQRHQATQRDPTDNFIGDCRGKAIEVARLLEQIPSVDKQQASGWSRRNAVSVMANQQLNAKRPFEFRQGCRNGRLRNALSLSGKGHRSRVAGSYEQLQLAQGESHRAILLEIVDNG